MNIKNTKQDDQKEKDSKKSSSNGLKLPKQGGVNEKTSGLKIPKRDDDSYSDNKTKTPKNKPKMPKIPKPNIDFSWLSKIEDFIELKYVFMIIGVVLCFLLIRQMHVFEVAPQLINPEVQETANEQNSATNANPISKYEVTEDFYNALITEGIIAEDYIEVNGEMDYTAAQEFAMQYKAQTGRDIKPEYSNCNFVADEYLDLLSDGSYAAYEEKFLSESQGCNITTDEDYRIYLGYLDLKDANEIVVTSLDGGYTMDELIIALEDIESPDVYISLLMRCPEMVIASELINNEAYVPSYTGSTVTFNEVETEEGLLEDINKELGYSFTGVYQYKITTETDGEKDVWIATVLTNGIQCYLYDITLSGDDHENYKQAKMYLEEN